MRYWDEIETGQVDTLGTYTFTEESILRFAKRFDPQPFHLDREAAKASLFGGLCASGWQTAAIFMRLNVLFLEARARDREQSGQSRPVFGPSPGVSEIRWLKPVYAGDTLTYKQTLADKRLSASRPEWGIVTTRIEARNQDDVAVFTMHGKVFIRVD